MGATADRRARRRKRLARCWRPTRRAEFLLLGTGATLQRPPPAFVRAIEAQGIGVEAMDSRAAARAWAVLRGEGRWVIGALYPL